MIRVLDELQRDTGELSAENRWPTMRLAGEVEVLGDQELSDRVVDLLGGWHPASTAALARMWRRSYAEPIPGVGFPRLNDRPSPPTRLTSALAGFHPSGYERQEALRILLHGPRRWTGHPLTVRAVALRRSDWVPQVRAEARSAVATETLSLPTFVQLWGIAEVVRDHRSTWLRGQLLDRVRDLPNSDRVALSHSDDVSLRRAAVAAGIERGDITDASLLDVVGADPDVRLRAVAVDELLRRRPRDQALVGVLIANSAGTVRAAAVGLAERLSDVQKAREVASAALLDRKRVVRETAQNVLRRLGEDPADRYRSALSNESTPHALLGLGECGSSADLVLLRSALRDPDPSRRAAALTAVDRLGGHTAAALVDLLADVSGVVVKRAFRALTPRAAETDTGSLLEITTGVHPVYTRRAALSVLKQANLEEWITTLTLVLDDPDLDRWARVQVRQWLVTSAANSYVTLAGQRAATVRRKTGHAVRPGCPPVQGTPLSGGGSAIA